MIFSTRYNLYYELKQSERVLNAIPKSFIILIQNTSGNSLDGSGELPSLLFNGNDDLMTVLPNELIRSCFNSILYSTFPYHNAILQVYDNPIEQKLLIQYISFPVAPKANPF